MRNIIYFLLLFVYSAPVLAQTRTLSGKVIDGESGKPLPGVTVLIKGTNVGTSTDAEGGFKLGYTTGNTLVFSFVGYLTQELAIDENTTYNVTLQFGDRTLGEVLVVGSRNANRTKVDSPVPVDVIELGPLLESAPQVTVTQLLQYIAPSLHSLQSSGGDAASATNMVQLRGLAVDQLLVLVNGKRRHKSANINFGGNGNGSSGYDLNAIPTGAIDRIEILRDGAAAQYGSDGIAGVINIVTKTTTDQLHATATTGIRYTGDGLLARGNANYGFKTGKEGGFVNVTAEFGSQGIAGPAGGGENGTYTGPIYGGGANVRDYDAIFTKEIDEAILAKRGLTRRDFNQRGGPNRQQDALLFFNAASPLKGGAEFYAFGGISYRRSEFTAVRRLPGWGVRNNTFIYPDGFLPAIDLRIADRSLATGLRGKVRGWLVDLSNVYGKNIFTNRVINSLNATLGLKSPRSFEAGSYNASQNTTSLDFSRYFPNTLKGLNVAFGAKFRLETYQIVAGEPASYLKADTRAVFNVDTTSLGTPYLADAGLTALNGLAAGSQIYPGFRPESATNVSRSIAAAYLDVELNPTEKWLVAGAIRGENYSDFGNVVTGKIASKYTFSDALGLRGSASTGFRGPDLAQFYYTAVSTGFQRGVGVDFLTASNVSAAPRALGIPSLIPEKSVSYSFGATSQPLRNIELSADIYFITIRDRVIQTGNFSATSPDLPPDLQSAFAATGANQANFFFNGINSLTRGLEVTSSWRLPLANANLHLLAAGNFSFNEVQGINLPVGLDRAKFESVIFSPTERARVETQVPQQKITLQGIYTKGNWQLLARAVWFGKVTTVANLGGGQFFAQTFRPIWVADLSASYRLSRQVQFTFGANNLFNQLGDYTDQLIAGRRKNSPSGIQNGGAGGQLFVRVAANF